MRPDPPTAPLPPSAVRSVSGLAGCASRPILAETCSPSPFSLLSSWSAFPPPAHLVCTQRLALQVVSRDHENSVQLRLGNVNDPQVPASPGLSDGNSDTFSSRSVFARPSKYVLHLRLTHAVRIYMRQIGLRVDVVPHAHWEFPRGASVSSAILARISVTCHRALRIQTSVGGYGPTSLLARGQVANLQSPHAAGPDSH